MSLAVFKNTLKTFRRCYDILWYFPAGLTIVFLLSGQWFYSSFNCLGHSENLMVMMMTTKTFSAECCSKTLTSY